MRVFIFLFALVLFISCDPASNFETIPDNCRNIIIGESAFQEIEDNQANIIEFEITDDCLKLTIGVSGCDAEHEIDMITDGGVDESLPVQINFVFRDNDPQECEAYFQIDREFDLSRIRTSLKVDQDAYLNFPFSNTQILYKK